jgi:hypothetical protein
MPNRKTTLGIRNRRIKRADGPYEKSQTLRKLQTLHERIHLCRQLASECACKAETAASKECREDYLRIEKSWINLAHSYEFAAQLIGKRDPASGDELDLNLIPSSSRLH